MWCLAMVAALCVASEPDWSGHWDAGAYLVIVTKTEAGYDTQWLSWHNGSLRYFGQISQDCAGRWIETYPEDLSPGQSRPWIWQTREGGEPLPAGAWKLKRLAQ